MDTETHTHMMKMSTPTSARSRAWFLRAAPTVLLVLVTLAVVTARGASPVGAAAGTPHTPHALVPAHTAHAAHSLAGGYWMHTCGGSCYLTSQDSGWDTRNCSDHIVADTGNIKITRNGNPNTYQIFRIAEHSWMSWDGPTNRWVMCNGGGTWTQTWYYCWDGGWQNDAQVCSNPNYTNYYGVESSELWTDGCGTTYQNWYQDTWTVYVDTGVNEGTWYQFNSPATSGVYLDLNIRAGCGGLNEIDVWGNLWIGSPTQNHLYNNPVYVMPL